jgi:hypothetical protein
MDPIKKLDELMAQNFPEQEYVIDRLVPDASITILSGASGSFKTYTLLQMAISVASGESFLDQFKTQQSGVLIIDEENGERLMQKRLYQLRASEDLQIYFTPRMGFELTDENIDNIQLSCRTYGIKLLIIDSLIRIHSSDENSAREMARVFKQLRRFTEEGIAVLVTQHNRKPSANGGGAGNEMRGSTDIRAAIDSHVGVTRKNKWYLTFDQTKQRYDVELDPFEVKVTADKNSFDFEYLGTIKAHADKSEILLTAITGLFTEHGQLRQRDLLEKLAEVGVKTNEHTLRTQLNRWVAEGQLPRPLSGVGNTKLYHLSEVSDE